MYPFRKLKNCLSNISVATNKNSKTIYKQCAILSTDMEKITSSANNFWYSDIRGVAVAGVEGEPVNLTEPVTEAIAAAFSAWLLNKKKSNGSRRLRVSIGHDSRVSAQKLQVLAANVHTATQCLNNL